MYTPVLLLAYFILTRTGHLLDIVNSLLNVN